MTYVWVCCGFSAGVFSYAFHSAVGTHVYQPETTDLTLAASWFMIPVTFG